MISIPIWVRQVQMFDQRLIVVETSVFLLKGL